MCLVEVFLCVFIDSEQIKQLEEKAKSLEEAAEPLKEMNRNLTAQRDTLIAESTALKNEVHHPSTLVVAMTMLILILLSPTGVSLADTNHTVD